jgi:hypothetical protein
MTRLTPAALAQGSGDQEESETWATMRYKRGRLA